MIHQIKIHKVKANPNNPRLIKGDKFKKLVQSIKDFPEMLKLRPIVVNKEMVVLGGNMRLKACIDAGLKEIWVAKAWELTPEQENEFIIKDNSNFGDWDWDILANIWDTKQLKDWGIDVWQPEEQIDYSVLDDIDLDQEIQTMYDQTKKSIILEYPAENFEPVKKLYDELKNKGADLQDLFYKAMQNYEIVKRMEKL
tara:strand:+ start:7934 stop:8524 length:591 start_codon:yes stop_codon:yes gene_type:complete